MKAPSQRKGQPEPSPPRNGHETAPIPAGAETTLPYDPAGRLASVTDANGNLTSYSSHAASRLISEPDPLGNQSAYSWGAAGQPTGVVQHAAATA